MPRALGHLRILELGQGITAAYAAKALADLGADVVKIELPEGDPVRGWPPFLGDEPGALRSGLFAYCNTNKRALSVDYRQAEGAAVVRALAAEADVVIENWPPGHFAALGLGGERLRAEHAALVVTSITPYGQSGPKRDWRGGDLTTHAASGIAMTTPLLVADPPSTPPPEFVGRPSRLGASPLS